MHTASTWQGTTETVTDTIAVGQQLGQLLTAGDILLLYGDLGAGKTHLSKGLVQGCGSSDTVTSPTFVFINEYRTPTGIPIFHIDLYRATTAHELDTIGLDDATSGVGICIIEWPERDPGLAEIPHLAVHIEHAGPDSRRIRIIGHGPRASTICQRFQQQYEKPS